jgi:hypothetical protein
MIGSSDATQFTHSGCSAQSAQTQPSTKLWQFPLSKQLAGSLQNGSVSRALANGTVVTVASEYLGDSLNSPNDVTAREALYRVSIACPGLY